jgi:hypothetical protein
MATTHVNTYTVGTLVVDLFDTSTKRVIWRGWATDVLPDNPSKETKKLDKEIEKLFKGFPPKRGFDGMVERCNSRELDFH